MRAILVLILLLGARISAAADNLNPLLGSWKLTSWLVEFVDTGERRAVYGEHPKGHLILLPSGRMMAVLTGGGRKPPQGELELAEAFRSMAAYTGTYKLEGNKWTTTVDAAWDLWICGVSDGVGALGKLRSRRPQPQTAMR